MRLYLKLVCVVMVLLFVSGCNTEAAKKAMDKPMPADQYTSFGAGVGEGAKRKADKPKEIKEDMDPDAAVTALVDQLQSRQASYSVAAEDQLTYWGNKPGVGPIVARKVRSLLKSPRIEHRAPALRLMTQFGGREAMGDYIECLNDSDPGMREMAYRAMQAYVPQDFGYEPSGSEVARSKSVEQMRRWWQSDRRNGSVQSATVYERNLPTEATIVAPRRAALAE